MVHVSTVTFYFVRWDSWRVFVFFFTLHLSGTPDWLNKHGTLARWCNRRNTSSVASVLWYNDAVNVVCSLSKRRGPRTDEWVFLLLLRSRAAALRSVSRIRNVCSLKLDLHTPGYPPALSVLCQRALNLNRTRTKHISGQFTVFTVTAVPWRLRPTFVVVCFF